MKRLFVFAFVLLLPVANAGAQELTKQAKIERLLDAMNADATINQPLIRSKL
jgi:hypothetical protein